MHDRVNGLFEAVGGLLLILNCRRMYKDKEIKGVSVYPAIFFTSWGYWNLFFYPAVNAWWSFAGGIAVAAVNTVWLAMICYYKRFPSPPPKDPVQLAPAPPGASNHASQSTIGDPCTMISAQ